MFKFGLMFF